MKKLSRKQMRRSTCDCGARFIPAHPAQDLCQECQDAVEHDANVTMFGDDADYLEHAGIDHEIGNR